jgi:hypothetical protein
MTLKTTSVWKWPARESKLDQSCLVCSALPMELRRISKPVFLSEMVGILKMSTVAYPSWPDFGLVH